MTDRVFHSGFGPHCPYSLRDCFVHFQTMLLSSKKISSVVANLIILLSSSPKVFIEDTIKMNFNRYIYLGGIARSVALTSPYLLLVSREPHHFLYSVCPQQPLRHCAVCPSSPGLLFPSVSLQITDYRDAL